MIKTIFKRGFLGFPIGISISYTITIIISLIQGQGAYYPCAPSLIQTMGSEIGAVILQAILSGLVGFSFAAASMIWEIENWSIARQTGLYFFIVSMTMLPVAYLAEWMEHSAEGFLSYFGIFVGLFMIIWSIQYFLLKQKIKKLNREIDGQMKK